MSFSRKRKRSDISSIIGDDDEPDVEVDVEVDVEEEENDDEENDDEEEDDEEEENDEEEEDEEEEEEEEIQEKKTKDMPELLALLGKDKQYDLLDTFEDMCLNNAKECIWKSRDGTIRHKWY